MAKAIVAVVGPKSKGLEPDRSSEPDMDYDDDEDLIGEDEMDAAKAAYDAKSPEEYAKALKAFVKLCYLNSEE